MPFPRSLQDAWFAFSPSPPVRSPGQDIVTHHLFREWLARMERLESLPLSMRCVFRILCPSSPRGLDRFRAGLLHFCEPCFWPSRELWTVGDPYGFPQHGFTLCARRRTSLATPESPGQVSQADSNCSIFSGLQPLVVSLVTPPSLPRPGQAFRSPGDPWTNSTSFGQAQITTGSGLALCHISVRSFPLSFLSMGRRAAQVL